MCFVVRGDEQAYERRRLHMLGVRATKAWAASRGLVLQRQAYAFWHDMEGGDQATLPDQVFAGLKSAVARGHLQVNLLAYQEIKNLPEGVCFIKAQSVYPFEAFRRLLIAGEQLPKLADHVRILAMRNTGGWFLDGDTLWLKDFSQSCQQHALHGHVFASLRKAWKQSNIVGDSMRERILNYMQRPRDGLMITSPFHIAFKSPFFTMYLEEVELGNPELIGDYNSTMKLIRNILIRMGLEGAVLHPDMFSPLNYHKGMFPKSKLVEEPMSNRIETHYSRVLMASTGVNCFWQSARDPEQRRKPAIERGSFATLHPESLWANLLAKCKGAPCRLTGKRKPGACAHTAGLPWPQPLVNRTSMPALPSMLQFDDCPIPATYNLVKEVASGTYGTVFLAFSRRGVSPVRVGIKIIRSESELDPVKNSEIDILRIASGPNIVRLLDAYASTWYSVLVMEYLPLTLNAVISQKNSVARTPRGDDCFSVDETTALVKHVATALEILHSLHIAHRDVHGGNVLKACDAGVWKLADFGQAAFLLNPDADGQGVGEDGQGAFFTAKVISVLYGSSGQIARMSLGALTLRVSCPCFLRGRGVQHSMYNDDSSSRRLAIPPQVS